MRADCKFWQGLPEFGNVVESADEGHGFKSIKEKRCVAQNDKKFLYLCSDLILKDINLRDIKKERKKM